MPWSPSDAVKHTKKANTKKKRKVWASVANAALAAGASEGEAVRKANSAVKKGK
jgi:uncharacterized protein YdaT